MKMGKLQLPFQRLINLLSHEVSLNLMKSAKVYKIHAIAWIFHFTES